MTKISTPSHSSTEVVTLEVREAAVAPRRSTLERIRQVARAYTMLSTTHPVGGMILN